MESQKIEEWLEKYWKGETSLEEEAQLRRYFQEQEPPAHLHSVAALFQHYDAPPRLDADFDEQLMERLPQEKLMPMWPSLLKIAAVVALFLLGALWTRHAYLDAPDPTPVAVATDTYEDPERAYEEAKQALLLVSSLMNEGTQHLTKLEEFEEAQQQVKSQKSTL
ncbi:MAG: hypothetical protein WA960_07355 [Tunicatimonas sp.]